MTTYLEKPKHLIIWNGGSPYQRSNDYDYCACQ